MDTRLKQLEERLKGTIGQIVFGHEPEIDLLLVSLIVGGHLLIEGPPGVAKTLLARTFADSLGLKFRRIQFTPDLMPSDITGVNIFDLKSSSFQFSPGPIFADVILADELNRTPPKTQAALLEAMEECQVTIDGKKLALGPIFLVLATQNPFEFEGTFPLPEAQLDRFLLKIQLSYPAATVERRMIIARSGLDSLEPNATEAITSVEELLQLRRLVREVHISEAASDYILGLVSASRRHSALLLGASPRAGLHLALAAKAKALLDGRSYVLPDDIQSIATAVLAHRLVLRPEETSLSAETVVAELLRTVPVPNGAQWQSC